MTATKDPVLFIPGPLTTSRAVKRSKLHDVGSRDPASVAVIAEVRRRLLAVANVSQADGYEVVPLQGSGTYAVEAVLASATPPGGKWLVVSNGACGDRMAEIAARHGIAHEVLRYAEDARPDPADVDRRLAADPTVTGVAAVHCETSTGMLNPVAEIGRVARRHRKTYAVDSMSAFGGVEFDLRASGADFLVSSANKCLEGVPGFAFVLCRTEALVGCRGQSRTLCLDLYDQWAALERTGQFRFTPLPTPCWPSDGRWTSWTAKGRPGPGPPVPAGPARRDARPRVRGVFAAGLPEPGHYRLPLPDRPAVRLRRLLPGVAGPRVRHLPRQGEPGRLLPRRDDRPPVSHHMDGLLEAVRSVLDDMDRRLGSRSSRPPAASERR